MISDDDGFVLVDALVAVVIVGIVGTAAFALGMSLMARGEQLLDRSQLLTNLESRGREVLAVGADRLEQLPSSADGSFAYRASWLPNGANMDTGRFVPVLVEGVDLVGKDVRAKVELLVARRGVTR